MFPSLRGACAAIIVFAAAGMLAMSALQPIAAVTPSADASTHSVKTVEMARITDTRVNAFKPDRGRWCELVKVSVFDPHHGENFVTDEKVCLGDRR
ncbi:MAG: hypothetical protein AAGF45_10500 [Pseudomonadota bacterium]